MKKQLIKCAIRTRFVLSRRDRVSDRIGRTLEQYCRIAESIGPTKGRIEIRVPPLTGVDEDMREWSLFMILEHNAIVNRSITAIVESLVRGEEPGGAGSINPKTGVMPSKDPGEEQIDGFRRSVTDHLETVSRLSKLRGTRRKRHPVFGQLDAHGWHCMFGLHLDIHLKQAETVMSMLRQAQD